MQAQSVTDTQDSCEVIVPKEYTDFMRAAARRVPSHFDNPSATSVIRNRGKVYTFRLATCILPEYVQTGFGNGAATLDKEAVRAEVFKWWDELETELNSYFTPEVGIRFKIERDERLILYTLNDHNLSLDPYANNNTRLLRSKEIVDACLGGSDGYTSVSSSVTPVADVPAWPSWAVPETPIRRAARGPYAPTSPSPTRLATASALSTLTSGRMPSARSPAVVRAS